MWAHLEDGAVVKVVGAGPALQGGEGHVAPSERGDVAEVVGAHGLLLIFSRANEAAVHLLVRLLAGTAVVLVRHPGALAAAPFVDGKALRTTGVELEADIGDVEGLPYRKQQQNG